MYGKLPDSFETSGITASVPVPETQLPVGTDTSDQLLGTFQTVSTAPVHIPANIAVFVACNVFP